MKATGILLVGYSAIDARIAAEVARMAFPKAVVKNAATLEEAIAQPPIAETDLLILPRPDLNDITEALAVTDAGGLPRWAVIAVTTNPVPLGAQAISPEEWAGPVTAYAFRAAIAQHTLRRDLARARGDLVSIGVRIAHELRTHVAGVLATAELSKELLQQVEPTQSELYQPIFDSVDNMGRLIERVSFLTKASTNEWDRAICPMKDSVGWALHQLREDIRRCEAQITEPEAWPEVTSAKPILDKIWLNLISNALAHSGDTPRIELGWRRDKTEYRFWIRDRGKGVANGHRSHLFQPFHLLHRPDTTRGLGLTIVQRLCDLEGGRCGYEPRFEGGSEFYFTLPV